MPLENGVLVVRLVLGQGHQDRNLAPGSGNLGDDLSLAPKELDVHLLRSVPVGVGRRT